MVVEVLVSQGDRDHPLCEHGARVVDDEDGMARVGDGGVEGLEETDVVADLAEQKRPGVGGEPAALEIGDDGLGAEAGKVEGVAVTVCHSDGLAFGGHGVLLIHILQYVRSSRN